MTIGNHLTAELFEGYDARRLRATEVLTVSNHVAACAECRQKLARAVKTDAAFAGIYSQTAAFSDDDFTHLVYNQLAQYVDGNLDSVGREIADSHLGICEPCREDLANLRGFQAVSAAPDTAVALATQVIAVGAEAERSSSWWSQLTAFNFFPSARLLAPAGAGLAVIALIIMGGWLIGRQNFERPIAQASPSPSETNITNRLSATPEVTFAPDSNTPGNQIEKDRIVATENPLLALNDSGGQIGLDSEGNLSGAENLPASVRDSMQNVLKSQRVLIPQGINAIRNSRPGVLMSGSADPADGVPFALASPVGQVSRDSQPTLRWKPLADAKYYTVAVVDSKFRVVAQSDKLNSTSWKTDKPLPRGANYSWQVSALKSDGSETVSPTSPAPSAKFRVMDQAAFYEVTQIERSGTKSHLARGIVYAQAGLLDAARLEFQALVKENPRSPLARRLLSGVR